MIVIALNCYNWHLQISQRSSLEWKENYDDSIFVLLTMHYMFLKVLADKNILKYFLFESKRKRECLS